MPSLGVPWQATFVEIAAGALVVCRDLRVMDEGEDGAGSAAPSYGYVSLET